MSRSERFLRYGGDEEGREHTNFDEAGFEARIRTFLNNPKVDEYCLVDAYYYDFSTLPDEIGRKYHQDMYLLYAIDVDGNMVSKWVERYEFDCPKLTQEAKGD
jgi:hypothetical protein